MGGVWMCCVLKAVRAAWRAAATTGVVTWVPVPGPGPGSGLGAGRCDARWRYRCMGCLEGAGRSAMMGHTPSGHWTACRDWGCKRWYLAGAKTWPPVATNQSQQMAIRFIPFSAKLSGVWCAKCQVPSAKQISHRALGPAPTHVTACERRVGPGPNATSTLSAIQPTPRHCSLGRLTACDRLSQPPIYPKASVSGRPLQSGGAASPASTMPPALGSLPSLR